MNKIYQYAPLLFLFCSVFVACHDDKGNYDYQEIKEITVKMPEQVPVKLPDADSVFVEITPEIIQPEGMDEGNLSFEWRIALAQNWEVYSQEKTLGFYVKPTTQNTSFRLGVTDVKEGITTYQQVLVKMVKPFEDTWFILQNSTGKAILATIDGTGESSVVTKDVLDAKYHGEVQLQGAPLFVNYTFYQVRNNITDWRLNILTDQGGDLYVARDLSKPVYAYPQMLFDAMLKGEWDFKPEYVYSWDRGNLMIDNGKLWYAYGDGFFIYFPVEPTAAIGAEHKITYAMPFYVQGSTRDYLLAFDDLNKRFLYCRPPSNPGVQELLRIDGLQDNWGMFYGMLEGSARLGSVPNYEAYPNVFSPEIGSDKSLLYMGNWASGNVVAFAKSNQDGNLHVYEFSRSGFVSQDTTACLNYTTCQISGNMDEMSFATSTSYRNIFFYSEGNCVYRVDMNRAIPRATVIYENPDLTASIKKIKFRHIYRNTWQDNTVRDERREQPYWLGLSVQKGDKWSFVDLKLAISGEVEKDADKKPKIYEYEGFDEIVDMTYTFPVN